MTTMEIFIICIAVYVISALLTTGNIHLRYHTPMGKNAWAVEKIHQSNCLIWTPVLNTVMMIWFAFSSPFNAEYRHDVHYYKMVRSLCNRIRYGLCKEYSVYQRLKMKLFITKYVNNESADKEIIIGDGYAHCKIGFYIWGQKAIIGFENKYYK